MRQELTDISHVDKHLWQELCQPERRIIGVAMCDATGLLGFDKTITSYVFGGYRTHYGDAAMDLLSAKSLRPTFLAKGGQKSYCLCPSTGGLYKCGCAHVCTLSHENGL